METKYKNNLLVQLLKLLGSFILAWLLIVVLFAVGTQGDEIPEKYNLLMGILAVVLAFVVNIIIDFNQIGRLRGQIQKTRADIDAVDETCAALIDKAERVADKYRADETGTYQRFADARRGPKKVRNGKDFRAVMEDYPELKANEHTQKLLSQLQTAENARLTARTAYSTAVAKYNAKIHSFPVVLLRKICKWEDVPVERTSVVEDMVTDEELGI